MTRALAIDCNQHDRFTCPEVLLVQTRAGGVGMPIRDGGSSFVPICWCPWCGEKVPTPDTA